MAIHGDVLAVFNTPNTSSNNSYISLINKHTGDKIGSSAISTYERASQMDIAKDGSVIVYWCNMSSYEYEMFKYDLQGNLIASYHNENDQGNNDQMAYMTLTDKGIILYDASLDTAIVHDYNLTTHKETKLQTLTNYSYMNIPSTQATHLSLTSSGDAFVWRKISSDSEHNNTRSFVLNKVAIDNNLNLTYVETDIKCPLPKTMRISYIESYNLYNFIDKETGEERYLCFYSNQIYLAPYDLIPKYEI